MGGMVRFTTPAAAALAALAIATLPATAPPPGGTLTLRVTNVRNATGSIHVDICRQEQFLTDRCTYDATVPARAGVTLVTVADLPPGRYAAQVFHDENNNRKVDRVLFGKLPKEGLAFSNDAFKRLAAPKWEDAQFAFAGAPQTIQLKVRYLLGASGPPGR